MKINTIKYFSVALSSIFIILGITPVLQANVTITHLNSTISANEIEHSTYEIFNTPKLTLSIDQQKEIIDLFDKLQKNLEKTSSHLEIMILISDFLEILNEYGMIPTSMSIADIISMIFQNENSLKKNNISNQITNLDFFPRNNKNCAIVGSTVYSKIIDSTNSSKTNISTTNFGTLFYLLWLFSQFIISQNKLSWLQNYIEPYFVFTHSASITYGIRDYVPRPGIYRNIPSFGNVFTVGEKGVKIWKFMEKWGALGKTNPGYGSDYFYIGAKNFSGIYFSFFDGIARYIGKASDVSIIFYRPN